MSGYDKKPTNQSLSGARTYLNQINLGNRSKDRKRSAHATVLISALDWSTTLSNFETVVETPFEIGHRMSNYAEFCRSQNITTHIK